MTYHYKEAISRNIGWISEFEQLALEHKKIAIAGMGGVGGAHLLTLVRLGIGHFHIADLDQFEVANFNRQIGANLTTLGQDKVTVLAEQAQNINPDASIRCFEQGINEDNIDAFLQDVDVFVDGFDFFVLDIRAKVFKRCYELGIPAITAAPIGMGTAYLIFMPGQMSFEQYFRLNNTPTLQQYVKFAVGLTPRGFHRPYLIEPDRVDLANKKGPSTIMAINLCAGVMATEVLKVLTGRGKIYPAPYYHQFDAFTQRWKQGYLPFGNANPIQRVKCAIGNKQFAQLSEQASCATTLYQTQNTLEKILDLARWAPSGDNTQPWQFDCHDEQTATIHCKDTRDHCVYDLDGYPTQIAIGALTENLHIAASRFGKTIALHSQPHEKPEITQLSLIVEDSPSIAPDALAGHIPLRATQRRPFSTKPISTSHKALLQQAVGDDFSIRWLQTFPERFRIAKLLYQSAHIRLTIEEAYNVHKAIIQWDKTYSQDAVPDKAVGLDNMNLKLMKWVMEKWPRVQLFNRFFAGTVSPRLQLDFIPSLMCGGHFFLLSKTPLDSNEAYQRGGSALQRFWLTAQKLRLTLQPEITPLIFSRYSEHNIPFTQNDTAIQTANKIKHQFDQLIGEHNRKHSVFMGRIGYGKPPSSRSIRKQLNELMMPNEL